MSYSLTPDSQKAPPPAERPPHPLPVQVTKANAASALYWHYLGDALRTSKLAETPKCSTTERRLACELAASAYLNAADTLPDFADSPLCTAALLTSMPKALLARVLRAGLEAEAHELLESVMPNKPSTAPNP